MFLPKSGQVRPFPFELLLHTGTARDNQELFIQTVEQVLRENLQSANSFGCTIANCHTHVGSKKHLGSFVEAELLFHNSYYNKGFAYLTARKILELAPDASNVWLVGYETFSELYLCETRNLLSPHCSVDYCVFETINSKQSRIRGLHKLLKRDEQAFLQGGVRLVFIVPISTTLTTHDKLISAFRDEVSNWFLAKYPDQLECIQMVKAAYTSKNTINMAVIVIGDAQGIPYWSIDEKKRILHPIPQKDEFLFQSLKSEQQVFFFSRVQSKWYEANECPYCFPDIANKSLTCESPIFEVNRASVVPMLQLDSNHIPTPRETPWDQAAATENICRIIRLAQCMYHHHIVRNTDHYQYYFDTETYFHKEKETVRKWLKSEVRFRLRRDEEQTQNSRATYHIIVAPRHFSNADFLHTVSETVFDGTARIFYFDAQREYRGNIEAKYSDFTRFVQNISTCQAAFCIYFHYVDDSIYMGTIFSRIKSLIQTLVGKCPEGQVSIFRSIILLLGRNSQGTKQYLLKDASLFFEYVHLNISPMRNHEDACTLCQLTENFKKMSNTCSTNFMSQSCLDLIRIHRPLPVERFFHKDYANYEKQIGIILRHMINARLKNEWSIFPGTERRPEPVVNQEDETDVHWVLKQFHQDIKDNNGVVAALYNASASGNTIYDPETAECSFFKAISRPFFSYSIRKKQGAFRFCLEEFERTLSTIVSCPAPSKLLTAQINALADMESNYLIRAVTLDRFFNLPPKARDQSLREAYYRAVKKLLTTSQDTAKSLLLETILVTGTEKNFFLDNGHSDFQGGSLSSPLLLEDWLQLYLENSRLIQAGFSNIYPAKQYDVLRKTPYYLRRFQQIFLLNCSKLSQSEQDGMVEKYCDLKKHLEPHSFRENREYFEELANLIRGLFRDLPTPPLLFICNAVHDNYEHYSRQYILLGGDNMAYNLFDAPFFQDGLKKLLGETGFADTLFCRQNDKFCVVKFKVCNSGRYEQDEAEENGLPNVGRELYCYIPFPDSKTFSTLLYEANKLDKSDSQFLSFFFGIKLLLSLRREFMQMIQTNFTNDAINRLVIGDNLTQALSISKASRHGTAQYYSALDYTEVEKNLECGEFAYRSLLNQYIQVLANNFISALYRDACSGALFAPDKQIGYDIIKPKCDYPHTRTQMYHLLFKDHVPGRNEYHYEMLGPCKVGTNNSVSSRLKLVIKDFPEAPEGCWKIKCLQRDDSAIGSILLILILLATNARFHTPRQQDECLVEVSREGQYLCVSNRIKNVADAVNAARALLNSQPHHAPRKSITLWTLNQYCAAVNNCPSSPEKPMLLITSAGEDIFQVKLPLFDSEED